MFTRLVFQEHVPRTTVTLKRFPDFAKPDVKIQFSLFWFSYFSCSISRRHLVLVYDRFLSSHDYSCLRMYWNGEEKFNVDHFKVNLSSKSLFTAQKKIEDFPKLIIIFLVLRHHCGNQYVWVRRSRFTGTCNINCVICKGFESGITQSPSSAPKYTFRFLTGLEEARRNVTKN